MAPSTRNPPPEHTPSRHSSSAEPQSLPTQGRPLRASLRSEAAGGTEITFPRQPDARLYSLAKLWQFSKNACNSKHFSLNRSVFVALGVAGTFPDSSSPAGSARPRSPGGTTPLTHGHLPDKESTGMGGRPRASAAGTLERNGWIRPGSSRDVTQVPADTSCRAALIGTGRGKARRRGNQETPW